MAKKSKKNQASEDLPEVDLEANPPEDYIEDAIEIVDGEEKTFEDLAEETEPVEDTAEAAEAEETTAEGADRLPELEDPEPIPDTAPAPPPERKGGFFPLLIGGLLAGAIGYGAAFLQWGNSSDIESLIAEQASELSSLREELANLPPPTDLSPLQAQMGTVTSGLDEVEVSVSDLGDQMATTVERIEELERRPNADGTLADTALAAFEADIQVLRDQLVDQQSELEAMTTTAASQLQATRDEAIAIEQNAVATARKATARTVLAQIQAAVETGAPLGALLSDLGGALEDPVPEALTQVSGGTPTLASLQESFPNQARAALSVARSEGVAGEGSSGLSSFLRNQFDVRSTAPQDGDSADAILSRAEDSLRTGQLNDALAEVAGLPEVVRGALSDWIGQAELRAAALDAIAQLSDTLNLN